MQINHDAGDAAVLGELGARIARMRLEQNISQEDLATRAGVGVATVRRLEGGRSGSLSNLVRIMRALGQLDRLDAAIAEPLPSPLQQLQIGGSRRQRAGRSRATSPAHEEPWRWGDEDPAE